jgi:hypothetical protein
MAKPIHMFREIRSSRSWLSGLSITSAGATGSFVDG